MKMANNTRKRVSDSHHNDWRKAVSQSLSFIDWFLIPTQLLRWHSSSYDVKYYELFSYLWIISRLIDINELELMISIVSFGDLKLQRD